MTNGAFFSPVARGVHESAGARLLLRSALRGARWAGAAAHGVSALAASNCTIPGP